MKKLITLEIRCGETTCFSERGSHCTYVGTVKMGTKWICRLFPSEENSHTPLEDKEGWLQRCPKCMKQNF